VAYYATLDITCLKEESIKGVICFDGKQLTIDIRFVVREARLEPSFLT
jgi:hypothetical protein